MSKPFFLAKSGQIYGPFDRGEIESLRESGEYEKYTWFWDQGLSRWQAIDPPPPPPRGAVLPHVVGEKPVAAKPASEAAVSGTPTQEHAVAVQQSSVSETRLKSISAICHDQQSVVSGTLANVSDAGCEFVVSSHSTSPDFQEKLPVTLHLLDVANGQSMNVSGRLGRIDRRDGHWVYRIHWKRCPQLLSGRAPSGPEVNL